ncbi:hypothetical protein ACFL08_04750 [Patescibacteria group bacterium]
MDKLNEMDQEVIDRCAEKHAPECEKNLGELCKECSVYNDQDLKEILEE